MQLRVIVLSALLPLVPLTAAAAPCAGFNDVDDTSSFCPNVTWLKNRAITFGCAANLYCPNDPVTRLQMAAFMNRLGDALFPLGCAPGQVMKWSGVAWGCADDSLGGSGGGGTVTSIAAGTGLQSTPNPITGAGAINVLPAYQLPQACANGQVPKSNGAGGWTCGTDIAGGSGTVTSLTAGTGITLSPTPLTSTGSIAVNTTAIQQRVTGTCAVGSYIRVIAADGTVTCGTDSAGPANAFAQNGNAFGATAVLGTTDNNALDVRVNGARVMRFEPNAVSPNIIGGSPANSVTAGVRGATIGGGGVPVGDTDPDFIGEAPNRVTDAYGTVGGGYANRAGDDAGTTIDGRFATVGGGTANIASGLASVVAGGSNNLTSFNFTTVAGGSFNVASGTNSGVVGGFANTASGPYSTVGGGQSNTASGDTSWAGGRRARTQTADAVPVPHGGAFVWADNSNFDFRSTANNEFAARATGGARFVTAINGSGAATATFSIAGTGKVGVNTATPNANATLTVSDAAPTLFLQNTVTGAIESGRIRFSETANGADCRGGYLHFNGSANRFNIGVHDANDCDTANDIAAIAISRTNGFIGITGSGLASGHPFRVGSDGTNGNGAHVTVGGVWTNGSSRTFKEGFHGVDARDVLERVVLLPITTWRYTGGSGERHLGPVAEDFHAAFGLGGDDHYIGTVDADGVALAAIQGLNAKLEAKIAEQARENAAQRAEIEALKQAIARLAAAR